MSAQGIVPEAVTHQAVEAVEALVHVREERIFFLQFLGLTIPLPGEASEGFNALD